MMNIIWPFKEGETNHMFYNFFKKDLELIIDMTDCLHIYR